MNTKTSILILFVLVANGCAVISNQRKNPEAKNKISECRNQWSFVDLKDTVTIKLLMHDTKGQYDLVYWPNLFIGVDKNNDTIGLIDNFSTKNYKIGQTLKFLPYNYGSDIEKALTLNPVFKVHKKKKENELYCKIKILYYCKLKE